MLHKEITRALQSESVKGVLWVVSTAESESASRRCESRTAHEVEDALE